MSSIIQLEELFPSTVCFHDSVITNIDINYETKKAFIDLDLCAGDPNSTVPAKREAYITGLLIITDLIYFIIEPPDYEYLKKYSGSLEKEGLWIDIGFGNNPSKYTKLPQPIPNDAFYNWIFVKNWNSFIHIAAIDATIKLNNVNKNS